MAGWIKLSRDINKHWIWQSDRRLKWWIDILVTVNHADSKVLIKGSLIECKRGQSVMSLETWARRWNVTKKTVKDFFELLQKDSMLVYESVKISTRITVCNYESYQGEVNATETDSKRKVNGDYPQTRRIKNDKKEEELRARSLIFKNQVLEFKEKYAPIPTLKEFYEYWSEPNKSRTKMRFEMQQTWELSRRLNTWANRENVFVKGKKDNEKQQPIQSITVVNGQELI